jgi:hypothetical protein
MQDLEKELHIDITYDSKEEIAVIRSMVGSTATFFGVPLSEEIRAEDPEEKVKAKIRKVVGIGRRTEKIRDHEVTRRINANVHRDRNSTRTEEPVRNEAIRMDCPRMGGNGYDSGSAPKRPRVQQKRRKKKMREPSLKDTILIVITVAAFLLALSGAEMLTNMDPHPAAGCACLALGSTWIILIAFANSKAGHEFMEDVKCLK